MRYDVCMDDDNLLPTQKIVIAEDNPMLADIYKTRLELIGYTCFVGRDGEEAYMLIEREKPALVLMDMMMPKLSGDQVLRKVRSQEWGKPIRVYVISNLNEIDAPADLRDLGIEGYAVKANLTNDDIDRLVDNILRPAGQNESIYLD